MARRIKDDGEDIILKYNSGESTVSIGKQYGYAPASILRFLRASNVVIRNERQLNGRQYTINESFFDIIDTHQKAYVVGIIVSDGNITRRYNGSYLSITLHADDSYLLTSIAKTMGYNGKVHSCYPRNAHNLKICSTKLCDSLEKIGVYANKSLTAGLPNIDDKYFWSFLRGVFDGDGTISLRTSMKSKNYIGFYSGSGLFISMLYEKLESFGVHMIKQSLREKYHKLTSVNGGVMNKLYDLMYENRKDGLYITRKFLRLKKIAALYKLYNTKLGSKLTIRNVIIKSFDDGYTISEISKMGYNYMYVYNTINYYRKPKRKI